MIEEQKMVLVSAQEIKARAAGFKDQGYRLVQICCTKTLQGLEVNYSFDKDYGFVNLRVVLPLDDLKIESISGVYLQAFLYENEMHDLFGVEVVGMAIDYKGAFYRTAVKTPFNPQSQG